MSLDPEERPTQGPVIRDKRRIDPETGQVRERQGSATPTPPAPSTTAEKAVPEVEADVAEVKKALEGEDNDAISAAAAKLAASSQKMGSSMYASAESPTGSPGDGDGTASGGSGGQGSASGGDADEDVVDAEIVDEGNDTPPAGEAGDEAT